MTANGVGPDAGRSSWVIAAPVASACAENRLRSGSSRLIGFSMSRLREDCRHGSNILLIVIGASALVSAGCWARARTASACQKIPDSYVIWMLLALCACPERRYNRANISSSYYDQFLELTP